MAPALVRTRAPLHPVTDPNIIPFMQIFIDDEAVSGADLAQRALAHLQAAHPSLTAGDALANAHIYVRADLDVAYLRVVSVVDALQQARFDHVAISAQQA